MDIFEAINTRCSVRKFKPDIPPLEDIKKIIDAARVAPSARNAQMWRYVVILNDAIKAKMRRIIDESYDRILEWPEAQEKKEKIAFYKYYSTFFTEAPVNIAILMEVKGSVIEEVLHSRNIPFEEIQRIRPNPALQSIGASIENFSLAAHALGYGTCWLTAPLAAYKELETILDVESPMQLVSFLCLGIPLTEGKQTPKKPLEEIMTVVE